MENLNNGVKGWSLVDYIVTLGSNPSNLRVLISAWKLAITEARVALLGIAHGANERRLPPVTITSCPQRLLFSHHHLLMSTHPFLDAFPLIYASYISFSFDCQILDTNQRLRAFEGIGGMTGVFVCGERPYWFYMGMSKVVFGELGFPKTWFSLFYLIFISLSLLSSFLSIS